MNRSYSFLAFALFFCVSAVLGDEPPNKDAVLADEHDPKMVHWKWVFDVRLPGDVKGPYVTLPVPTAVFGKAQQSLNDLRLVDAKGKHVPYLLRDLRGESQQTNLPISREFNKVPSPTHRRFELSLELMNVPPSGYNDIDVVTTGINFRRKVEVFGDDSDKFANPRPILGKGKHYAIKYEIDGKPPIESHHFHFDRQLFRFLQIHVYADGDEEIPSITHVDVRRSVHIPGEFVTEQANLELGDDKKGQPVRAVGGPGSAWLINLPGEGMVPCQKLKFEIAGPPSERPFEVQIANPNKSPEPISISAYRWTTENQTQFLEISFSEVFARRLRFVVTDFANEPFFIQSVQATRAVRQLVFAKPDEANLRLFAGNFSVGPPNYVQAPKVPPETKLSGPFAELDQARQNPEWIEPPPTLNERMPWLVYVVLGCACLILLVILGSLARQAIKRHDATVAVIAK